MVVSSIPDQRASAGLPERYGARQFQMFAPIMTNILNYVRTISLIRDGSRWRFDANGMVQPFEKREASSARKIADRFPPELLVEYAAALGLRPFDPEFYPGPSVLVVNPSQPRPAVLVGSIAEIQRYRGIVPNR